MADRPAASTRPSTVLEEVRRSLRRPFDLAAVVTVAVAVPSPGRAGLAVAAALAVLGAAVVLLPAVRRSPWAWALFGGYHALTYATGWYRLDNHDALIAYWCIALAVATATRERDRVAALQARYLVGVTFLVATTWKVLSQQFVSGDFFTYALLVDTRFAGITRLLTGVSAEQVAANGSALAAAASSSSPSPVTLDGVAMVSGLVTALTWGTILVEAAVAATMLWPDRQRADLRRSVVLVGFLLATYLIVPVSRFGMVLIAMGIAQVPRRPRVRIGLAVGAVALLVWGSVWEALRQLV